MMFRENLGLAIESIKHKDPQCTSRGKKTVATSLDNEDNTHIHSELATDSLESDISRSDFELVLQVLNLWLKQDESIQSSSNSFLVDLQQLTFAKTTEEHNRIIVLLRLHFQEQMKLPAAAKLIGMEVHTARRRKDDALKSIQSVFINNNITGFSL
jgi:sulfur relay (sulfurtransferase) DsrC/TusE family protein